MRPREGIKGDELHDSHVIKMCQVCQRNCTLTVINIPSEPYRYYNEGIMKS